MGCFGITLKKNMSNEELTQKAEACGVKARDMRITAFALGVIALLLLGFSYALFGLGTLPPTSLIGLGIFPYLGGAFFGFMAIGIATTSVVTIALSGVYEWQKNQALSA